MNGPQRFPADPEAARREVRAELFRMDCSEGMAGTHGVHAPQRRRTRDPIFACVPAAQRGALP